LPSVVTAAVSVLNIVAAQTFTTAHDAPFAFKLHCTKPVNYGDRFCLFRD